MASSVARTRQAAKQGSFRWIPRRSERAAYLLIAFAVVNVLGLAWNAVTSARDSDILVGGRRGLLKKEFTAEERFMGVFYALGVLYCLVGLAEVCESFFVASLESLGSRFGLSEDVSGATLMAAGSSLPEVFSSFVALLNPNTDNTLGMDTIVGSSVYNTLVIVGASAIAAGDLMLDWKPLYRDIGFYYITITYMFFVFRTGEVTLIAGLIAVGLYCCYVGLMSQNQKVFKWLDDVAERRIPFLHNLTLERQRYNMEHGVGNKVEFQSLEEEEEEGEPMSPGGHTLEVEGSGMKKSESHLSLPPDATVMQKISHVIKLPWLFVFTYTVPDCRTPKWNNWVGVWTTFGMSIVWIGIIAWFMVAWASHVGCVSNVPDIVIGLTVLAAGTSLPDTISSVVVARRGGGDMAVANAIGSNVFNVLFGLGFPWTFFCAIRGNIPVPAEGLVENVVTLALVGIFYTITFTVRRFRLNTKLGYVFMGIYACYVVMVIVRYWILAPPSESECV